MIRLHMPAIPHTLVTDEFSHFAFTGKILRFAPMMISRGFEVYYYGIGNTGPTATKNIDLLTKDEWQDLRIQSYRYLHGDVSSEQIKLVLSDKKRFVADLAFWNTPLYKEFNSRFKKALEQNYRSTATDIVCLPHSQSHEDAIKDLNVVAVESGVGYNNSYKDFRIFESYSVLHQTLSRENKFCQHYWFVIPMYYNISEWPLNLSPTKQIGFLGRIGYNKGCDIFKAIAKKFPHIEFIICGQGDATPYTTDDVPNITYKSPIEGLERGVFLGNLTALIAPSMYAEPFGSISAEAQLCGTPVISNDFGAFVETVEPFKTGMLCHTLADFCLAVQMALDGKFDRQYISDRATKLYDMYNVGKKFEYAFKTYIDRSNGKNGWYSPDTYIELLDPSK